MARRTRQSPRAKALAVKAGDYVLIGEVRASMPSDWSYATVLVIAGDEIGIESTPAGNWGPYRRFVPIDCVRAVGEFSYLFAFKREAEKACAELQKQAREAESALGAARAAVYQKLDEIADALPALASEAA